VRVGLTFLVGLRHHSQGQIIPVAAFVAGLEVAPVDGQDRAVACSLAAPSPRRLINGRTAKQP
jgi:hypothetical protein